MSEKSSLVRKRVMLLIGFIIIVALAYFGGEFAGKTLAKSQNAADAAQQE